MKFTKTTAMAAAVAAAMLATSASAEFKMATLDIEKIVDLHPDTAHNREILKDTLKDYQGEMSKLEDSVAAARKAASAAIEESRNPALGEKARKRAEEEAAKSVEIARSAERDFLEKRQDLQRSLNEQELRLLRITVRQVETEVAKYAKANGISIVLPITGSRLGIAPAAVWADDALDITAAIMSIMGIEEPPASSEQAEDANVKL
ncbi:MAG: OmpH family outer membrane protein [Kiritimatiellae bacterium]|nr:OmpH family outer membrane protein [Kiritimatiellia bacterium]